MTPKRLKSKSVGKSNRGTRFVPTVFNLEERTVPATFYVDPLLAGQADNASVTFNAGQPNSKSGLVYASSLAFYNANQATVNAFSNLGVALQVSEANAGADTVRIANGQVPIPNPSPALGINSITVTQDLTLIGSGKGVTTLTPTNNTTFDGADDEFTSVFRVSGGNFRAQDLRFEGGGKLIGSAFVIRSGATGTFDSVTVSGTIFAPTGASTGAAIVGFNAVKLAVLNSDVSNYGRNGVLFINTPGSVVNSTITGRGAGSLANNGIEVAASKVFITGNLISGNNGTVGTDVSSGIIALNDAVNPALVSDVIAIGNTITGNAVGLNVGTAPNDGSVIRANYNSILNNQVGAFGKNAVDRIIAPLNWWGDATGPFNVSANPFFNNPTGLGNPAQSDVKVEFRPFLTNPTPRVATLDQTSLAAGVTSYLTQISTVGVAIVPVGPSVLTTPTPSVQFNVTFATPVTGFDSTDVVTSGTIGGTKAVTVTGSGANYVVTVSGLTGFGTLGVNVPIQAALDPTAGFLTAASNTSTFNVAVARPTTFFVDPTFTGLPDNSSVTFNVNYPQTVSGLVYASSFAFWNANQSTVNAFSDLGVALQVSEANPGGDTIRIAHGQIPIPNPNVVGDINSINITQDLTLIGSGRGATILSPTNDTTFDSLPDEFTSVFRVTAGNFKAQDLRFEGGGKQIGAAFVIRSGATGTFDSVAVSGAIFTPTGASTGASIVGFNAVKLDVRNSDVSNYGRNGVLFINTPGSVVGTNVTGRGAGNLANNGIEVNASKVFITGSMITGNNGSVTPTDVSSGVIALNDAVNPALVSDVTLVGNTITGNTVGLNLGVASKDGSIIRANYNNIFGNEVGAFGKNAVDRIIAPLNWWGDATGPFNVSANPFFNNPTGLGNPAQSDVKVEFRPFLTNPTPKVSTLDQTSLAAGVASYLTQISTVGVAIVPATSSQFTTPQTSVTFNVTFAKPVIGFDSTDVVTSGTIGGTKAVAVTGSGANYVVTVSGLTGTGTISINTPVQAALDNVDGFLSAASNTSTITVAVVPPSTISGAINPVGSALLTTATSSVQFAVTFSTPVTGFDTGDIVVGGTIGGTKTATITGSGANYTVTVSGLTGNGTITLQIPQASFVDPTLVLGASTNTATITVAVPPVVPPVPPAPISVAINPVGPASPTTAASSVQFAVTFNNAVTGFDAADVVVGGTIGGTKTTTITGSGANYTVTVGGLTGNGTVTLQIPQASVVDPTLLLGAASNTATITVAVPPPVVPPLPTKLYAIGADAGSASDVQVYGANGVARFKFVAFESTFTGGVRVATADVNGDGTDDIIVAAGQGGAARIRIINGMNGEQIANFYAYDPSFRGGAFVAAGDLNGDGRAEIVTGAGAGGGPHVRVFDANGNGLQSFFAYSPTFTGGVTVAVGDTNGDGTAEIVTGPGAGGGPHVRTFNGQSLAPISSFFAFDTSFTGGVFVAVGNVGANGAASIVAGPGTGGLGAIVRVTNSSGTTNFTAYEAAFTGGVRVAVGDTNGDGRDDIITTAGPTGGARIRGFNNGVEVLNALAFDGTSRFGYFVG